MYRKSVALNDVLYAARARVCVLIAMYARFIISNIRFYCEIESLKTRIKHDLLSPSCTRLLILYASTKFFDFYNYTRVTVRVLHVVNTRIIKYQNGITDYKECLVICRQTTRRQIYNVYNVNSIGNPSGVVPAGLRCRHTWHAPLQADKNEKFSNFFNDHAVICLWVFYHSSRPSW